MRVRSARVAIAVLGLSLPVALPAGASAGTAFTISVPDTTVPVAGTFVVNSSNACASGPYKVTFTYTTQQGEVATSDTSGTADSEGAFSQEVTVPEAAVPDQPASVQASSTCPSGPPPAPAAQPFAAGQAGGTMSNTVSITVQPASGTLSTDKTQGRAGTVVDVSGTNCLGDEVIVVFGNDSGAEEVDVVLLPDNTFSGDYTVPNVPPGPYFFAAACPGTDYADRGFTVLATPGATPTPLPPRNPPAPTPPPAQPPTAIPGPVNFTG